MREDERTTHPLTPTSVLPLRHRRHHSRLHIHRRDRRPLLQPLGPLEVDHSSSASRQTGPVVLGLFKHLGLAEGERDAEDELGVDIDVHRHADEMLREEAEPPIGAKSLRRDRLGEAPAIDAEASWNDVVYLAMRQGLDRDDGVGETGIGDVGGAGDLDDDRVSLMQRLRSEELESSVEEGKEVGVDELDEVAKGGVINVDRAVAEGDALEVVEGCAERSAGAPIAILTLTLDILGTHELVEAPIRFLASLGAAESGRRVSGASQRRSIKSTKAY